MDKFDLIRADLDVQLHNLSPNVGIAFGSELFNEFRNRGWFTLEKFGVLGTTLFTDQLLLPAYQRSHCVFLSWAIDDLKFQVGGSAR